MRILSIKLENLNSLAGKWEIDLTSPEYTTDGIFAITGQTGAGKSTILDAVCLALYGCTPRLKNISKTENELLSRQTSGCSAEVTFETSRGRYRCWWEQHRARNKTTGELQSPRHEICDALTGTPLETATTKVIKLVEEVTGLDFERFTRSMLLAQGGFAAFLTAKNEDRSAILEQITGTEVYSKISCAVFLRKNREQETLDGLEKEYSAAPPLSAEDEQRLQDELTVKIGDEQGLNEKVKATTAALGWLEGIVVLEKECADIALLKEELQKRIEDFQDSKVKLDLAQKALELDGQYSALKTLRHEQAMDNATREKLLCERPTLQTQLDAAEAQQATADKARAVVIGERENATPLLKKVRALDLSITERKLPITAAETKLEEEELERKEVLQQQMTDELQLGKKRRDYSELEAKLVETAADGRLEAELTGINRQVKGLTDLISNRTAIERELESLRISFTERRKSADRAKELHDERKQEYEKLSASLNRVNQEYAQLLDGRDIAGLRGEIESGRDRLQLLDACGKALELLSENRQKDSEQEQYLQSLKGRQELRQEELERQIDKNKLLSREVKLLEDNISLQKTIESFDEARKQHLHAGEACPLCGSLEHPWADGSTPAADRTISDLEQRRKELAVCNEAQTACRVELEGIRKDILQATQCRNTCAETIELCNKEIVRCCIACSLDPSDTQLQRTVKQLNCELKLEMERGRTVLDMAEKFEKQVQNLRERNQKVQQEESAAKQKCIEADNAVKEVSDAIARYEKDSETIAERIKKECDELNRNTEAYHTGIVTVESAAGILKTLASRRDTWGDRQKKARDLEREISTLNQTVDNRKKQIEKIEKELATDRTKLEELRVDRGKLCEERQALFGDKNCDNEERRLDEEVKAAVTAFEAERNKVIVSRQAITRTVNQTETVEQSLKKREEKIVEDTTRFGTILHEAGFTSEEEYLSASLPDNERKNLLKQSQQLAEDQVKLDDRERTVANRLTQERGRELTTESRESLSAQGETLVTQQKELQQQIGAIRQKLDDNVRLKLKQGEKLLQIEQQKKECERWNQLNRLIGSSDGKKFRNFAQGLTFEIMIRHANCQLRKMTDRYLLMRDTISPLELNVCDNWQAGEVRSTKNLSGGESFIISLSLALGLSKMASEKIRVDSLFLDEGFGTLDAEALEIALDTLAGLRQDGKLIGIISHVPALKERIGTRIEVIRKSGGRSELCGPGVRKGEV